LMIFLRIKRNHLNAKYAEGTVPNLKEIQTAPHRLGSLGKVRGDEMLNDEKKAEFESLARPLIKFLNDNCHPHVSIHIENDHAELSEGVCAFHTEEYFLD
jgi:hypothetical protein